MLTLAFGLAATLSLFAGPLTDAEKADLQGKLCEPFVAAVKEAMTKAGPPAAGRSPDDAMRDTIAALKRPDGMKPADWTRCSALFERELIAYKARAVESEAKATLKGLSVGVISSFAETGELCPSSTKPVPADLAIVAKGTWASTDADWADPTWTCINGYPFQSEKRRFQYEVKTDKKAGTIDLIARGYPGGDGVLVTFTLRGKIVDGGVEFGELVRK